MTVSEREKMDAGEWYCCIDPELEGLRLQARKAVHLHNTLPPEERGKIGSALVGIMAEVARDAIIEMSFHCIYGMNISLGEGVYINAGCSILDTARVTIGNSTMLGPAVQIYCVEHHLDADKRKAGLEISRPVIIGKNVWIGGGAIILSGVCIGDNAVVGAGAVVTKDVAANTIVIGNPARVIDAPAQRS